ncbi:RICIN domain-containing protein [Streptomyces sp. NPDC014870]|uniref:RICIN domain-containing protein n=1 Tax=Streptomyces sp. NPDC014870 TaxID=3364925 RepID=UPI00370128FA
MVKQFRTLLAVATLAVAALAGTSQAAASSLRTVTAGTVSAAEAFRQVSADARAGEGRLASDGSRVLDSAAFTMRLRGYTARYCLDNFASGGGRNNSPVGFWECNGGSTLYWRWRVVSSGGYYNYTLVNNASGRCLDYPSSFGERPGAQFNVFDCKDGAAPGQTFHVYQLGNNELALTSPLSSNVLALDGYSSSWRGNGSPVGLWNASTSAFNPHQRWF